MKTEIDVTVQVEIAASRAAVWTFITDPERLPDWFEEIESAHQESDGPPGLGTVTRYVLQPGHRSGTMEVVEWEPESKLAWDGTAVRGTGGASRPRGSFQLTDAGADRTLFTGRIRPELSGMQVLLRPYLKHWIRRARRDSALKLKGMVEES